jgi:hypothetical protein
VKACRSIKINNKSIDAFHIFENLGYQFWTSYITCYEKWKGIEISWTMVDSGLSLVFKRGLKIIFNTNVFTFQIPFLRKTLWRSSVLLSRL